MKISDEAIRVLGVLIEKEKTTPDSYPLTLNSLVNGCNQSTNRHPVVNYDEMVVERALSELRDENLALRGVYAGSRVPKHRHNVAEALGLSNEAISVLAVLLLRGPQTLGEIKQRTERMFKFDSLDSCDKAIDELVNYQPALAVRLQREPGQKEARINHCVSDGAASVPSLDQRPTFQLIDGDKDESMNEVAELFEDQDLDLSMKVERLEKEVTVLTHEIMSLRAEIDEIRDPSA